MNEIPDPGGVSGTFAALERTQPTGSPFDVIRCETLEGREYWSGRDLMELLGYSQWRDFANAIIRARAACMQSGHEVPDHFAHSRKVTSSGPAAEDAHLSRYACYLVAMNADPKKAKVGEAQTYFAVRARESEVAARATFAIPQTFAEALRLAADEHEARELAEARVAELEPPAAAWTELAEAAGDYSVADAAKVLSRDPNISIGQNRLFNVMRQLGWIMRRDKHWQAYQSQVDNGRLVEKLAKPYYHQGRDEVVTGEPTVRITPKGIEALQKRLGGGSGQLALAVAE